MAVCPDGHTSAATDFCDVCGASMTASAASAASGASTPAAPITAPAEAAGPCPDCGTPKTGRFCEDCGFDFTAPPPAPGPLIAGPSSGPTSQTPAEASASDPAGPDAPGTWTAVITADRPYYDGIIAQGGPDADSIVFPPYCPERRIPLTGQQVRIGRRSVSRGITPEIDLRHPPEDPGVSHMHAVLLAQPDGTWSLVDPGSANGTMTDPDGDPIELNVAVPLGDGDRFYLGAWTAITLEAP